MGTLQTLDWIAIGAYFSVLLGVAWWVVKKGKKDAADYFLAGRNLSWWIIGASIFASNRSACDWREPISDSILADLDSIFESSRSVLDWKAAISDSSRCWVCTI